MSFFCNTESWNLIPFNLVGFVDPFPDRDSLNSDRMRDSDSKALFLLDPLILLYGENTLNFKLVFIAFDEEW